MIYYESDNYNSGLVLIFIYSCLALTGHVIQVDTYILFEDINKWVEPVRTSRSLQRDSLRINLK